MAARRHARRRSRRAAPAAGGRLERDLERAGTARDACEAVVDHLARRGLLPTIYLAQDGRLRCQAVRGVWQVYDGLPASTGVVGRVYRTGVPAVLDDVGESVDYLPAIPGVRAEVCQPLRVAGQVVGVLDVESLTAIDALTVEEIERCAGLLSARLEDVGAVGAASPAQRLARTAARLASTEDPEGVVREALAAALELSGYESGVVALADGHGALYPHLAEGSFGVAFSPARLGGAGVRWPPGSTTAPRPTPSATPRAAASSATRSCAAPASAR